MKPFFFLFLTPKSIEMQKLDRPFLERKLPECIYLQLFFSKNLVPLLDENDIYVNQMFNIENFFTDRS